MRDNMLKIENLGHCYGSNRVLNKINLQIYPGQFVALVGPSGCGKSTLFKAILGTHLPTEGRVLVDDKIVSGPNRNVGIVYQHYNLYDFLISRKNVAFGLKLDQTNLPFRMFCPWSWKKLYEKMLLQADEMLSKFGLEGALHKYPSELSGGMRQRVAIAQALIMQPKIVLLDEPFGALDEITRSELQTFLLKLYQKNLEAKKVGTEPPYTVMLVTHELNEAFYVADRVIGLTQYHTKGFLGATIMYDEPAPVFGPNDPRDFSIFQKQKEELKKLVFEAK
jgi:NitT/TauT family transport system ATP-binding protein